VLVMKLQPVGGDFWEDDDPSRTNNDTIGIFNEGLEQLVATKYADFGVRVVDMQATAADLSPDGIHLTEAGYRKAASAWYDALRVDDVLDVNTERPSLSRTRADDSAPWTRSELGDDGAERLTGKGANDRLDGGAGGDIMKGRKGDDSYFVDDRYDRVVEKRGGGTDTVYTTLDRYRADRNVENVTLQTAGDAVLIGNRRDNVLRGGGGEDTIKGGLGNDILLGGGGDDTFAFRAGQADGDRVRDFQEGDVLQFKGFSEGAVLVQLEDGVWSLSHRAGVEVIQVIGQGNLSEGSDYFFV
jgi:Ca2+-binding RTX toxin-like protein